MRFDRMTKHGLPTENTDDRTSASKISECVYVEILVFGVHETPLLLREVHMIDGTMLIMFLDRRNNENS